MYPIFVRKQHYHEKEMEQINQILDILKDINRKIDKKTNEKDLDR